MSNFFKILFSDPKLDLTCTYSASTSISKILEQEKAANRFKVMVSIVGLSLTVIVLVISFLCKIKLADQAVIGTAISGLIAAMALEDATDSKIRLLESIQSKISEVSDEDLRKKYLDMLFKIVETQSFPK